jgi:hypothetical protein
MDPLLQARPLRIRPRHRGRARARPEPTAGHRTNVESAWKNARVPCRESAVGRPDSKFRTATRKPRFTSRRVIGARTCSFTGVSLLLGPVTAEPPQPRDLCLVLRWKTVRASSSTTSPTIPPATRADRRRETRDPRGSKFQSMEGGGVRQDKWRDSRGGRRVRGSRCLAIVRAVQSVDLQLHHDPAGA